MIGLIAVLVLVVIGGAAAFVWFKFFRAAPDAAAVASAPAVSAPLQQPAPAASVSGGLAPVVSAMADAAAPAAAPEAPANAGGSPPSQPVPEPQPAAVAAQPGPSPQTASPAQAPPADHTLKIASDLVREGEHAYSQGDYKTAVRRAHSALDVHAGYAPAEKLLRRSSAAQKRVAEQRQLEQQRIAAEQAREQAAREEAAEPPPPTPDQIYNLRAHSECARGFFGKSCRHKIRVAVCQGVEPGSPGSTVCAELKD